MKIQFAGKMFEWRGPAPFHFIRVPEIEAMRIRDVAAMVTYGWGVVPATVSVGETTVETSLFPKDGGYLVPIKNALRLPEKIALGDTVVVRLSIDV